MSRILSQSAFEKIVFWNNNQLRCRVTYSQSSIDRLSSVLQAKYIVYSSLQSSMLQKCRNTHWHNDSLLHCGLGCGSTYEITLPLVIHNNYCRDTKCVYWIYRKISISYRFRFGEISRNYWWLRTFNEPASVQLLIILPTENHKLEKPLRVVLRGSCFIISLKMCFWLLVTGLPKFKWLEVQELLDLQGNNGREVISWLISLHM